MLPLDDREYPTRGYFSDDTICAIATQVGGAISIVRVSGRLAFVSLNQLTQSASADRSELRKMIRSRLYSVSGNPLDDALYVRFAHPNSYTGEDLVEYHLHGGAFTTSQLMDALLEMGIRQALPGEFSFRAVKNGKLSLFQAQAVADLIAASNENAVSLALEKMSGSQIKFLEELASRLRKLATLGEVGIDFSDQDVDEVSLPRLKEQVSPLIDILENLKNSFSRGLRLQEGISVAFVGLPNAGKSSFFNALLGEDRSIVSPYAGTTRDVVCEKLSLRGKNKTVTFRLSDTAGLRNADHPVEKMGIERTLQTAYQADIVFFIVDPNAPFSGMQDQWNKLQNFSNPRMYSPIQSKTIGILTKLDQTNPSQLLSAKNFGFSLGISLWVATSAVTGAGIQDAIHTVIDFSEQWIHRAPGEMLLTRLDHKAAVEQALNHLNRSKSVMDLELFASDIRHALHSLSPLIGETLADDILEKIFSNFCIGK